MLLQTDYRKGKRFKKLCKLISGHNAQKAVDRFSKHTYLLLLTLLVAQVVCFWVGVSVLDSLKE
jgi:hypothetical protein